MTKNFKQLGFTLIELLIVITLMMAIAAFTFTNLQTQMEKSRDGRRRTDLENIRAALEMFRREKNRYPTDAEGLGALDPDFIPTVPQDPRNDSDYYYDQLTNFTYDLCAHLEGDNAPGNCAVGGTNCGGLACNYRVIQP